MDDVASVIERVTGSGNPLWQWAFCAAVFLIFLPVSYTHLYPHGKDRIFKKQGRSCVQLRRGALHGPAV